MGILLNTPPLIIKKINRGLGFKQNLVSRRFEDKIIMLFIVLLIGVAIVAILFFDFTGTIKY